MYKEEREEYRYLNQLIERYPLLENISDEIKKAYLLLEESFSNNGKLLVAGNGGSCADGEHLVGELMKGFIKERKVPEQFRQKLLIEDAERGRKLAECLQEGLPAIALGNHSALNTAYMNDVDSSLIYAQQVNGYGKKGDIFMGISTSGNAENVMYAAVTAKAKGMKVIALCGKDGGNISKIADCAIIVPCMVTYMIQEYHLPIYHCICLMLEDKFFA